MLTPRRDRKPEQRRQQLDAAWWGNSVSPAAPPALFASGDTVWPRVLLGLLMAMVFYLPNIAQIPGETGIRGVNPANILFLLILAVMATLGRPPSTQATPLKLPLVLFMAFLTWAFVVAIMGDSSAWVEDVTVYKNAVFYLLLYFLFFHAVRDLKTIRILVLLILFVMFTSGVLGVRQAFDYGLGTYHDQKRVAAPFGWEVFDANRAAVFFCIYLQLVGAAALFLKSRPWLRLACAFTFAMGVFVVFHTYSRQAYLILAVLIFLIAIRKHFVIALLAGLALFHYEHWVPETVVQRIEMTSIEPEEVKSFKPPPPTFDSPTTDFAPIYGEAIDLRQLDPFRPFSENAERAANDHAYDESTESRFTLWAGAWELITQRPTGIGMNRFKREISPYVPAALAGKDAHNFYVLFATEAGLIAPLSLLALLIALVLLGQRLARMRDDEEAHMLGTGFVMATLAVALGNVYGSRFLDGDVMGNYWILAALVARAALIKEQERRERQVAKAAAPVPVRAAAAGPVGAGVAARAALARPAVPKGARQ